MLTKKTSEVPFWAILLGFAAVLGLVLVAKEFLFTQNVISSDEGTFIKNSFMGGLTKAKANEVAKAHVDAVTEKK